MIIQKNNQDNNANYVIPEGTKVCHQELQQKLKEAKKNKAIKM